MSEMQWLRTTEASPVPAFRMFNTSLTYVNPAASVPRYHPLHMDCENSTSNLICKSVDHRQIFLRVCCENVCRCVWSCDSELPTSVEHKVI